eukprot:1179660-Prorocentrum_minimum.AAC.4
MLRNTATPGLGDTYSYVRKRWKRLYLALYFTQPFTFLSPLLYSALYFTQPLTLLSPLLYLALYFRLPPGIIVRRIHNWQVARSPTWCSQRAARARPAQRRFSEAWRCPPPDLTAPLFPTRTIRRRSSVAPPGHPPRPAPAPGALTQSMVLGGAEGISHWNIGPSSGRGGHPLVEAKSMCWGKGQITRIDALEGGGRRRGRFGGDLGVDLAPLAEIKRACIRIENE